MNHGFQAPSHSPSLSINPTGINSISPHRTIRGAVRTADAVIERLNDSVDKNMYVVIYITG